MEKLSIKAYAAKHKLSIFNVVKMTKSGQVPTETVVENGKDVVYIILNDDGLEVLNFGKHKGKTVEEVFTKEPSYYSWMMNSEFPLHTKKVLTNIKLRKAFTQNRNTARIMGQ